MRYPAMDASSSPAGPVASLRILASGSAGNCSVLVMPHSNGVKACLIDAGLSPRRTQALLAQCGLKFGDVACVLLTHLDRDHWHSGWVNAWPSHWHLWLSAEHARFARRRRLVPLDAARCFNNAVFEPAPGLGATPVLAAHDELGVASYRFDVYRGNHAGSVGFATDLGRVPERVVDQLRHVDVLAIESNYCPQLQMSSPRPWHVKQRIMGGHGHLSNDQAIDAIKAIEPREHVVLLHLSRECNDQSLVASLHAGSDYSLTIADQEQPTRWISVPARTRLNPHVSTVRAGQLDMFPVGGARDA